MDNGYSARPRLQTGTGAMHARIILFTCTRDRQEGTDTGTGNAGTERIAAFSDGVIAIIITIMVLELKLSDDAAKGEVWSSFLTPLASKLVVYALSFVIVGASGSITISCWLSYGVPRSAREPRSIAAASLGRGSYSLLSQNQHNPVANRTP
jgi:hypothetical protein